MVGRSQAQGSVVGVPLLAGPQGVCLWHAGNVTNSFLFKNKFKKKNIVLHFPLFSSAGLSTKPPPTDRQLQGTIPTGKLLCVLYG